MKERARPRVPDLQRTVFATRGEQRAVGAEGERAYYAGVRFEPRDRPPALHVHDPDDLSLKIFGEGEERRVAVEVAAAADGRLLSERILLAAIEVQELELAGAARGDAAVVTADDDGLGLERDRVPTYDLAVAGVGHDRLLAAARRE